MEKTTIKRQIFKFIVENQAAWRVAPNMCQVRNQFRTIIDDVDLHLEQLEREGLIHLPGDGTIELLPTVASIPPVEIRNALPAGNTAFSSNGTANGFITLDLRGIGIRVETGMHGFTVIDDAMADAGIMVGDIAILSDIDRNESDIHAVHLNGHWTLRRLVKIDGALYYLAENPIQPDLTPTFEVPSYGALWGVLRAGLTTTPPKVSYSANNDGSPIPYYPRRGDCVWPPESEGSTRISRWVPESVSKRSSRRAATKPKEATRKPKNLPKLPPELGLNERTGSVSDGGDQMQTAGNVVEPTGGITPT